MTPERHLGYLADAIDSTGQATAFLGFSVGALLGCGGGALSAWYSGNDAAERPLLALTLVSASLVLVFARLWRRRREAQRDAFERARWRVFP